MGAGCEIENIKGYAPLMQDAKLSRIFEDNALVFISSDDVEHFVDMTGSTDMGDVSLILPAIQPTIGGFDGALHSKDFSIVDKEFVYITASKILACTVYDLIKDNCAMARKVVCDFSNRE